MKNLLILLALSIMVSSTIFISSCKKEAANTPPVANFTFTGDNNPAPCVVSFTNSSTNATSYNWGFGDGSTSTDQNPQHTYTTGGTFTVQLTATGAGGSNSITKSVIIQNPVPIANFTFTGDNNPAPCVVSFTNSSTNATSYIWDFGDGTQTSTDQNPQHTYTTGGTFTVQLTATGTGGSNSTTKSVVIINPVSGTNITFNNPIFTNIYITLNGTIQTILPGSSVTFYSVPGSSVSYLAHTYGTASDGTTQIGIELDWNYTINLPGGNISYTLIYTSTVFFLYMKNVGTHTLTPLYVNYGLSQQTEDRILIPNDNVKYSTGYYYAFSNTVVRAYYQDNPTWYTYWQNINFPGTDNQSIELINTFKKSASIDETHTSIVNPQLLKPAGNLKLNSKFDKKAINVYCK